MKSTGLLTLLILLVLVCPLGAQRVWDASMSRKNPAGIASMAYTDAKADSATGFDVQKYEISLEISQNPNYIEGSVLATVLAEEALDSISYELVGLTVSAVQVNGSPATFSHEDGLLTIPVNAAANETFLTRVFYSGTPQLSGNVYNVGMYFQTNSIFTISDPDAGRFWWPCYDHPWDKAIVDLIITMRSDWKVAANGLRESIVDNGDGTATTTWRGEHPMTTYLVCITAGPYVEIAQTARDGELPILNFVTQNQYNNALTDLANLPTMIDYYSELFGEYPFEKYGNATVSMSTFGAMEHQTMTTLGNYIITGNQTYEITIAHELAHQWFGNAVSFLDFPHVWLSEGFATYSEHLWVDHQEGWQAACDYVLNSYQQYYMNWENSYYPPAIYNPGFGDYFSPPSYEKAASVLHMLRLKLGDAHFFQLLQDWFSTYRDGNVVTAEFQALAESISGLDLQQFFQQWIYGTGIPSVNLRFMHKAETGQLKVIGHTTSPTSTAFEVDLPIRTGTAAAGDSLLVFAGPEGYENLYTGVTDIEEISLNHNNWALLREISEERLQLVSAIGAPEVVHLRWNEFSGVEHYEVYYRPENSESWIPDVCNPHQMPVATVINLVSGGSYEFMVLGVDSEGFRSRPSNILIASPVDLKLDLPMLVVDETRDGNGTYLSPDDAMVDDFYAAAISPYEFDMWDVATQGLPQIDDLSHYRTVFWHADDFSQNLAFEAENTLLSYFYSQGNLIFSGWRSANSFSDVFWHNILGPEYEIYYDNGACLSGLDSYYYPGYSYPELNIDQEKLAAPWNGMLPMINTFETSREAMYLAEMPDGFEGNGRKAGLRIGERSWFLGFPLYYMQSADVRNLMQNLIDWIQTSSEDEHSPVLQSSLKAYPNPFNPSTSISFLMPEAGKAKLKLYNLKGQLLKVLADDIFHKGEHSLHLDLSGEASGIYIISLESSGSRLLKRISLMK